MFYSAEFFAADLPPGHPRTTPDDCCSELAHNFSNSGRNLIGGDDVMKFETKGGVTLELRNACEEVIEKLNVETTPIRIGDIPDDQT